MQGALAGTVVSAIFMIGYYVMSFTVSSFHEDQKLTTTSCSREKVLTSRHFLIEKNSSFTKFELYVFIPIFIDMNSRLNGVCVLCMVLLLHNFRNTTYSKWLTVSAVYYPLMGACINVLVGLFISLLTGGNCICTCTCTLI